MERIERMARIEMVNAFFRSWRSRQKVRCGEKKSDGTPCTFRGERRNLKRHCKRKHPGAKEPYKISNDCFDGGGNSPLPGGPATANVRGADIKPELQGISEVQSTQSEEAGTAPMVEDQSLTARSCLNSMNSEGVVLNVKTELEDTEEIDDESSLLRDQDDTKLQSSLLPDQDDTQLQMTFKVEVEAALPAEAIQGERVEPDPEGSPESKPVPASSAAENALSGSLSDDCAATKRQCSGAATTSGLHDTEMEGGGHSKRRRISATDVGPPGPETTNLDPSSEDESSDRYSPVNPNPEEESSDRASSADPDAEDEPSDRCSNTERSTRPPNAPEAVLASRRASPPSYSEFLDAQRDASGITPGSRSQIPSGVTPVVSHSEVLSGITPGFRSAVPSGRTPGSHSAVPNGVTSGSHSAVPNSVSPGSRSSFLSAITPVVSHSAVPNGVTSGCYQIVSGVTPVVSHSEVLSGITPGTCSTVTSGVTLGSRFSVPNGVTAGSRFSVPNGVTSGSRFSVPNGVTSGSRSSIPSGITPGCYQIPSGVTPVVSHSEVLSGITPGSCSTAPSGRTPGSLPAVANGVTPGCYQVLSAITPGCYQIVSGIEPCSAVPNGVTVGSQAVVLNGITPRSHSETPNAITSGSRSEVLNGITLGSHSAVPNGITSAFRSEPTATPGCECRGLKSALGKIFDRLDALDSKMDALMRQVSSRVSSPATARIQRLKSAEDLCRQDLELRSKVALQRSWAAELRLCCVDTSLPANLRVAMQTCFSAGLIRNLSLAGKNNKVVLGTTKVYEIISGVLRERHGVSAGALNARVTRWLSGSRDRRGDTTSEHSRKKKKKTADISSSSGGRQPRPTERGSRPSEPATADGGDAPAVCLGVLR